MFLLHYYNMLCFREGLYGVYTKVSRYQQWIKDCTSGMIRECAI